MYGDAPPGNSSAARGGLLLTILDSYSSRFRCMSGMGEQSFDADACVSGGGGCSRSACLDPSLPQISQYPPPHHR